MHIVSARIPGAARLAQVPELSRMARQRLKWFDHYQARGHNVALTCCYFGISRQTLRYAQGQAVLPVEAPLQSLPPGQLGGAFPSAPALTPAYLVTGTGLGGAAPAGAVPSMGERQAGGIAPRDRMARLYLHGETCSESSEGPQIPAGAPAVWYLHTEAFVAAALRRAQTQGV